MDAGQRRRWRSQVAHVRPRCDAVPGSWALEIENEGGLLPVRGAKQRALLALLLMHPNEVVSRDLLIEGLWGESAEERAGHALEAHVSRLRKSLGCRRRLASSKRRQQPSRRGRGGGSRPRRARTAGLL